MPVWKYRSVAEMPRVMPESRATLASRIAACWERGRIALRPPFKRGVQKVRRIEDAQRDDDGSAESK